MSGALKLQSKIATTVNRIRSCEGNDDGFKCKQYYPLNLRLNNRKLFTSTSLSLRRQQQSHQLLPDSTHRFIPTVGSSSPSPATVTQPTHWTFTHAHIRILYFVASAAAISATWLFCSAIPALLAFKRAAESMEKLMDVTREELPDTMAAVRLSGMEISDLTMELSDLGQEITQGVRSSTRAVRLAEERLRHLTNMTPSVSMQEVAPVETRVAGPVLARTARNVKEGIVKGRAILQILFTLTRYSGIAFNYFRTHAKT